MGQRGIDNERMEISGTGSGNRCFGAVRAIAGGDNMRNGAQLLRTDAKHSFIELFTNQVA